MLIPSSKNFRAISILIIKGTIAWALSMSFITILSLRELRFLDRDLLPLLGTTLKVYIIWTLLFFIFNMLVYNDKYMIKFYLQSQRLININKFNIIVQQILCIEYPAKLYMKFLSLLFQILFLSLIYCMNTGLYVNVYIVNWLEGTHFSALEGKVLSIQNLFTPVHGQLPILWILFFCLVFMILSKWIYRQKLILSSKIYATHLYSNK